jgi:hypothetical protein
MVSTWQAEYQPPRMPKYSPRRYSVGVDLGQANDPTAIAVLAKTIVPPETALFAPVGESPSNRLVEGSLVYDLVYLTRPKLERVMNLGKSRIGMRISRSAWFPRDLCFPHSYAVSNEVLNTL